jgi:hypothetical protein
MAVRKMIASSAAEFIYAKHERRGHAFANQILSVLYDFIPACGKRGAWNALEKWAEQHNLEIVPIPDDLDAQQWLDIETSKYAPLPPLFLVHPTPLETKETKKEETT